MTLIFGIAGIIQAVFLPGYVLVKRYARKIDFPLLIILSFGLSILINYTIAMLFCALGMYTRWMMISIFVIELFLCFRPARFSEPLLSRKPFHTILDGYHAESLERPFVFLARLMFFVMFIASLRFCIGEIGKVFTSWDCLVFWNPWAVQLSENTLPVTGWIWESHPKLMPSLSSLPYIFMGDNTVQFFSYAIFTLYFPIAVLASYCIFKTKNYFPALIALLFILWHWRLTYLHIGYVDFPLAVTTLCCLTLLFVWQDRSTPESPNGLILFSSMAFAAAAASTKAIGIIFVLAYPLLLWHFSGLKRSILGKIRGIFVVSGCMLCIAVAWYVCVRIYKISIGGGVFQASQSELMTILNAYASAGIGYSLFGSIAQGWKTTPVFCIMFLLSLPALFFRRTRIIAFIGIAWGIFWFFFLTVDGRNVGFSLPFLGIALGLLIARIALPAKKTLTAVLQILFRRNTLIISGIGIVCIAVYFSDSIHSDLLLKQHLMSLKTVGLGEPGNSKLLAAMKEEPLPLVTSWQTVPHISGFPEGKYQYARSVDYRTNPSSIAWTLNKLGAAYILVRSNEEPYLKDVVALAPGNLERLFFGGWWAVFQYTANPATPVEQAPAKE